MKFLAKSGVVSSAACENGQDHTLWGKGRPPAQTADANNRLPASSGYQYDGAGNMTQDGNHNTYFYDAENRLIQVGGTLGNCSTVGITYDALGDMVEQNRSGSSPQYIQIVYAPDGTKLGLTTSSSALLTGFVPLTGGATAVYNSSGNLAYYRHSDWLGSSRLASTPSSPTSMYSETAYEPFGEPYDQAGTADANFTGMNQDTLPNLDLYDFPAREYGDEGRWVSPDPLGIAAVDPTDPQSWNRYAYVRNNPLALIDPTGLDYIVCSDYSRQGQPTVKNVYCDNTSETWDQLNADLSASYSWAEGTPTSGDIMMASGRVGGYVYWCNPSDDPNQCIPPPSNNPLPNPNPPGPPLQPGPAPVPTPVPPKQIYDQCMADYQNSTTGKAVSFFSLFSFVSNMKEWLGFGGAKVVGVRALDEAEKAAAATNYSVTAGKTIAPELETGSKVLGNVGTGAVVVATLFDVTMRQGCMMVSDPKAMTAYTLNP